MLAEKEYQQWQESYNQEIAELQRQAAERAQGNQQRAVVNCFSSTEDEETVECSSNCNDSQDSSNSMHHNLVDGSMLGENLHQY